MDTEKIIQILDEIKKFETIILQRHLGPDGDAFGSQLGLKKLIQLNFPDKKVYAIGTQTPRFECLGLMDQINDDLFANALVIITDTASIPRIEDERFNLAKKVIKIDHHPNEHQYGDLQWVDAKFTSASEMIGLFAKIGKLKINQDIAKTILYGIITDTSRFGIEAVSALTFEVCSFLMEPNWNIQEVYQDIAQKQLGFLQAEADVIQTALITNGVGVLYLTDEIMQKYHIPYDQNDMFTNLLEGIKEIKIRVVFSANQNGTIRVEFRSDGVVIKQVAEKFGGGGHNYVCGATIKDWATAQAIVEELKLTIKK